MQVTTGLVQAMRNAGLDVVEMDGWQGRGETDGSFSIRGIILHHDAMGLHNDNVPQYMSQNGVDGSQLWIKYTGQVYVMAAGRKWHAGSGGGFRNIPAQGGNAYCIGIETDYSGSGPRDPRIDEAIHTLTRVLVTYYGMDPQRDLACHREYAPDRKVDLASFDADAWRASAGGAVPINVSTTPINVVLVKTPEQLAEEELMTAKDEIIAAINAIAVPIPSEVHDVVLGITRSQEFKTELLDAVLSVTRSDEFKAEIAALVAAAPKA